MVTEQKGKRKVTGEVSLALVRRLKVYAAQNGLTQAEAIERLLSIAFEQRPVTPDPDRAA